MSKAIARFGRIVAAGVRQGVRPAIVAVLIVLTFLSGTGSSAPEASRQIIFSGAGAGRFGDIISGIGFWVWCQEEPRNPYGPTCSGAVYVYRLGHTHHVEGTVEEIETPSGDEYIMHVASRDGEIVADLRNIAPTLHGPNNTVEVTFFNPPGFGRSRTSVVNVTGPEE